MLSIAVCDDDILECCHMVKRIRRIMDEYKMPYLIRQFTSGQELLEAEEDFDLIFLDILMQELNGLQTAEYLRSQDNHAVLIFITSSRDYVFDAYDVEAFQYLLKPVGNHRLKQVLEKALSKLENHSRDFIIISKDRQKKKLFLDDIYYFEGRGRLIYVHGKEGILSYYEQIGLLEQELREKDFFRCHKSYLINLNHVDSYNRQEVILDNGEGIMLAKRRYEEFCKTILLFMKKSGGML